MKQILILSLIFFVSPLMAKEACFTNPSDPFNVSLRFTKGKHVGSCIYTEVRRTVRVVDPQYFARTYGVTPPQGQVLVANFRHDNQFWIASIPMNKIIKTYIQAFMLMGPFSHLQLRFLLQEGAYVELYPQNLSAPRRIEKINDFVFALHALRAVEQKDEGYSPISEGLNDGYGVAYNMRSTTEDVSDINEKGIVVEQFELNLTRTQQTQLLRNRLELAKNSSESDLYHTATKSCVTAVLEGIYAIVPDKLVLWSFCPRKWSLNICFERNITGGIERWAFKTPFNPAAAVDRLKKQGYIKDTKIPNLGNEFSEQNEL